jgi:hypothetical protein
LLLLPPVPLVLLLHLHSVPGSTTTASKSGGLPTTCLVPSQSVLPRPPGHRSSCPHHSWPRTASRARHHCPRRW